MQHPTNPRKGGIAPIIRLKVTARDAAGNVIAEQTKDNDIYLWNWACMIAVFLKNQFAWSDAATYAVKNLAGTTQNVNYYYGTNVQNSGTYGSYFPWANTWRVQIGSGSNAPTITDYAMQTFVQEVQPTIPEIVIPNGSNILKLVFSSTFSFTAETICAETGIRIAGLFSSSTSGTANQYLITRDTFTPITVPAAGTITLQHELWFNGTP